MGTRGDSSEEVMSEVEDSPVSNICRSLSRKYINNVIDIYNNMNISKREVNCLVEYSTKIIMNLFRQSTTAIVIGVFDPTSEKCFNTSPNEHYYQDYLEKFQVNDKYTKFNHTNLSQYFDKMKLYGDKIAYVNLPTIIPRKSSNRLSKYNRLVEISGDFLISVLESLSYNNENVKNEMLILTMGHNAFKIGCGINLNFNYPYYQTLNVIHPSLYEQIDNNHPSIRMKKKYINVFDETMQMFFILLNTRLYDNRFDTDL